MNREKWEIKELRYLYRINNQTTRYKLDINESRIVFPRKMAEILKKEERTIEEKRELREYRYKILHKLNVQSWEEKERIMKPIREKKREINRKRRETLEKNNAMNPNKVKHMGVWLNVNRKKPLFLTREGYAQIDKKVTIYARPESWKDDPDGRDEIFADETCTEYTDKWCEEHRIKCLENYELNISFFEKLNEEEFDKAIRKIIDGRKGFKQILDLNEVMGICGIYILILDKYKSMYIGQAMDIKRRIMAHWSDKIAFDRLIFGDVKTSVLSIDSFGALDITRIFVYPVSYGLLDKEENKIIDKAQKQYLLNRVEGGIKEKEKYLKLALAANRIKRNLGGEKENET